MYRQIFALIFYIKIAVLLVFSSSFFHQVFIYGMSLEQTVHGKNVYTGLNESTQNASLSVITPNSFDLLTRILAMKYQLNLLLSRSHSDPRGKKASIHPYSDIRSFISILWGRGNGNDEINTLSNSTKFDPVQTTSIYPESNGAFQGHDLVKAGKGNKSSVAEPITSPTSLPHISQNNSDIKFNMKIEQSSGYGLNSRKKAYSSSLRMAIESEDFTFVYPGNDKGRPFFESDEIFLKDAAFNKKRIWFLLHQGETTGEAYMDSSVVFPESTTLYCMVRGTSEELVYGGWHRWGNETSGTKSLHCESVCKSPGTDPFTITNFHLRMDDSLFLTDSEQINVRVKQIICLQPPYSGLYICIAVDAKNNVFLSATHDIRIVNVVRSTDSNITPPPAVINENDSRQTFIDRYCAGHFSPRQNADRYSAQEVDFFYIDERKNERVQFTVKTLHTQKWTRAEKYFENLNRTLPAIIRCKFDIQTLPYSESRYVQLYFRLTETVNKTQNTITAVRDETLNFYCVQDTFDSSKAAHVSYSEGMCSENENVHNIENSSRIRLRINKEICVTCSSLTAEIRLQVNVEQDLKTLIPNTDNEQLQGACPVLDNLHSGYFSVKNSDVCEQNAVSLFKKTTQQYQNRMMFFNYNTFKSYYTSRQFMICRDQPIPGPAVVENPVVGPNKNTIINIVLLSTIVIFALLLLLAWKQKCSVIKLIRKIKNGSKFNCISCSLKRRSALFIDDIMNAMDRVHPRENIERSRISIKDVLHSGKMGNIYKACLKTNNNSNDENEVVAEELKWPTSRKEKQAYLRQINQQIQVLRVITPHINILRYYGFSISSESNLIVMEFVNGVSLLDYLHEQRRRMPGFVFKARYHVSAESKSDITNVTCSSVDSEDSLISYNGNHCQIVYSRHQHEHRRVSGNIQTEVGINERKDSNSSVGDFSVASDTNQGVWYVNFENDDSEYLRESNVPICPGEFNNKAANQSLVMEILSTYRQVARAMAHLSNLNIILCELEASNVIVQLRQFPLVVKICDFSSAYRLPEGKTVYKRQISASPNKKWLPPEAVQKGAFTVRSDVWTYGMFCWEVSTLGCLSYDQTPVFTVAPKTNKRNRLPRPPGCDEEIFTVIESCWKMTPEERPSFENLVERWSDILEVNSDYLELKSDEECTEILDGLGGKA